MHLNSINEINKENEKKFKDQLDKIHHLELQISEEKKIAEQ